MRGRCNGAKIIHRSYEICIYCILVEERSVSCRRYIERCVGGIRSANADMSNDNVGENPTRRKSKVSCSTPIGAGLVGPKVRLKSVIDGKQVNIPALVNISMG